MFVTFHIYKHKKICALSQKYNVNLILNMTNCRYSFFRNRFMCGKIRANMRSQFAQVSVREQFVLGSSIVQNSAYCYCSHRTKLDGYPVQFILSVACCLLPSVICLMLLHGLPVADSKLFHCLFSKIILFLKSFLTPILSPNHFKSQRHCAFDLRVYASVLLQCTWANKIAWCS